MSPGRIGTAASMAYSFSPLSRPDAGSRPSICWPDKWGRQCTQDIEPAGGRKRAGVLDLANNVEWQILGHRDGHLWVFQVLAAALLGQCLLELVLGRVSRVTPVHGNAGVGGMAAGIGCAAGRADAADRRAHERDCGRGDIPGRVGGLRAGPAPPLVDRGQNLRIEVRWSGPDPTLTLRRRARSCGSTRTRREADQQSVRISIAGADAID
jgi:hypothetical protein